MWLWHLYRFNRMIETMWWWKEASLTWMIRSVDSRCVWRKEMKKLYLCRPKPSHEATLRIIAQGSESKNQRQQSCNKAVKLIPKVMVFWAQTLNALIPNRLHLIGRLNKSRVTFFFCFQITFKWLNDVKFEWKFEWNFIRYVIWAPDFSKSLFKTKQFQ